MSKSPKDLAFKIHRDYYQKVVMVLTVIYGQLQLSSKIALIKGSWKLDAGMAVYFYCFNLRVKTMYYME
jgi:hypothetical protein